VVENQKLLQPLSVIASSMSGYVAIKLLDFLDVENIILLAPAIYASKSYSVPFGPKFSEIIRKQYSWRDSDVWEILKDYTGNLLIFAAEKDRIISDEVIEKIHSSAVNANFREIISFKDATHPLVEWLDEHSDYLEQASDKIHNIIERQLKIY